MLRTNTDFLAFLTAYNATKNTKNITLKSFNKGNRLLNQGSKTNSVYILKEGIAKCFITEENAKNYIFEFLGSGEIIGEIEIIKKIPCLCNVEAITDLVAFSIPNESFLALLEEEAKFNKIVLEVLSTRLIQTSSRSSYQQLYPLEHGFNKLLQLQEQEDIAISKEDMSAYLGITLRSFNRMLKNLNVKKL